MNLTYKNALSIVCLFFGLKNISAQTPFNDRPIGFSGNFTIVQAFDSLKKTTDLAFSKDKLPSRRVKIKKSETVLAFLDRLSAKNLLRYTIARQQIIIRPYIPKSHTINGVLKDQKTGEHIIGANIQIAGTKSGTTTNGYGYFSITLLEGDYEVVFSHVGYITHSMNVVLNKNVYLKPSLSSEIIQLDDVVISSRLENKNVLQHIPSVDDIYIGEAEGRIPYLFGEVDVIQNALLRPGIKVIGEDASGFHVRGGGDDQNLTLFDEATVYNPNHLNGLVSIFNPEAVNNIKIYKGYAPPSFGGRASSIVEVRQKEGNNKKISYSGGIGYVSARALVEGPIKKGKSSFLVGGRQSLLGLSLSDFGSSSVRRNRVSFQDLNLKLNSKPNTNNQFYLSGYLGNDRNAVGLSSVRRWGNRVANFRWGHLYSPQLFSNISTYFTAYNYRIENDTEPGAFVGRSRIRDFGFKADYFYTFKTSNELIFGFSSTLHDLLPGIREPFDPDDSSTNLIELERERGFESALYIGHDFTLNKLNFNYGLRYSTLHNLGSGSVLVYEDDNPLANPIAIDTTVFSKGKLMSSFATWEPRIAINWLINDKNSIKTSFARNAQYIHLISNTLSPAPTDIWKLTEEYIPPLVSEQYSVGFFKNLLNNSWEFSSEIYYKDIANNIQYKNGADLVFNQNIETELVIGDARAYGLEVYLGKRKGKLKGWVSYTLSRAESRIPDNGIDRYVLEDHDKTHDFSTSWSYDLAPRLNASTNFIFNTGIPVTLPTDKFVFEDNLIPNFGLRNSSRIPNYHRLDISLRLQGKERKKNGAERKNKDYWIFTVYNVYSRKNPYSYFFRESETDPGIGEIVQFSIFGTFIPAVTYNFKF